jgi:hypothetical protein
MSVFKRGMKVVCINPASANKDFPGEKVKSDFVVNGKDIYVIKDISVHRSQEVLLFEGSKTTWFESHDFRPLVGDGSLDESFAEVVLEGLFEKATADVS